MPEKDPGNWNGEERRQKGRDDDLVQAVVCAIREEALIGGVPPDQHREQHAFITEWMEEMRLKRERWEKVRTHVVGWLVVATLGAIGKAGYALFEFVKEHWK